MNRFTKFTQALRKTPAEIEAEKGIQAAHDSAKARIEAGYSLGQGNRQSTLHEEAERQGLCLSFNKRLGRALGAAWAGDQN